jgi:peptide/nickel transport system substrate-binding protein
MRRTPHVRARIVAWTLAAVLVAWLLAHVDALGGRPLVVIWARDPGVFDPHNTSDPVAYEVFRHVCEPLFYEDFDGRVRGQLAEDDVAYGAGDHRLTVRLRPGIAFHDGTPLDAAAVAASFERLRRSPVSPLADDLRAVTVDGAPGALDVTFELPGRDFEFVRLVLANPYTAIVSPAGASDGPGFVACTGAWRFVPDLYEPGLRVAVDRFDDYRWPRSYLANRGPAAIRRIVFAFEPERDRRFARLTEGDGCVLSINDEQAAALAGNTRFRIHDATGGVTYLGFNFQRPRWQDRTAREAVAAAIDKAALAASGPFDVADTPLAPGTVGFDPAVADAGTAFDRERARRLLDRVPVDRASELVLLVPESETYAELADLVAGQLAAVGFESVRVRAVPAAEIMRGRQDFDLLLSDYAWGDYTALAIFLGTGPRDPLNYPGGEVAELITRARSTADDAARRALVADAQRFVLTEVLWQPLLVRRLAIAVNADCVTGELPSPEGELLFHDARTHPEHGP